LISLELKRERVTIRPRSLHEYIAKVDYIKSRRPSAYSSLKDLPKNTSADGRAKYVEIAMMASMKLSCVSLEEELNFDTSFEGFYYTVWQSAKSSMKWSEDAAVGVNQAEHWYTDLDDEDKAQIRFAIRGVDQRSLAKNSSGPAETPTSGAPVQ
jgi:hypothetical protein